MKPPLANDVPFPQQSLEESSIETKDANNNQKPAILPAPCQTASPIPHSREQTQVLVATQSASTSIQTRPRLVFGPAVRTPLFPSLLPASAKQPNLEIEASNTISTSQSSQSSLVQSPLVTPFTRSTSPTFSHKTTSEQQTPPLNPSLVKPTSSRMTHPITNQLTKNTQSLSSPAGLIPSSLPVAIVSQPTVTTSVSHSIQSKSDESEPQLNLRTVSLTSPHKPKPPTSILPQLAQPATVPSVRPTRTVLTRPTRQSTAPQQTLDVSSRVFRAPPQRLAKALAELGPVNSNDVTEDSNESEIESTTAVRGSFSEAYVEKL
ncbi:hypothetical protein HK096_000998 [Nowakowskiella sp. JEL0078]|nr:hypothetical protein HK096_000998 [Nowakowskiella sp. JEL0078]